MMVIIGEKYRSLVVMFVVLLFGGANSVVAQQFQIEEFEKLPSPIVGHADGFSKKGAVINFLVTESDFTFKVAGEAVEATSGDESLSIVVPKKSAYLEISHPEYGVLYWKSPLKLKRKRVYHGVLHSLNPKSEYEIKRQWVVVNLNPKEAIVKVDSLIEKIDDGVLQLYLAVGKHPIDISAPFYKPLRDTLNVVDSMKQNITYALRPIYSYIEVQSPNKNATLTIDGVEYPRGEMRSGKLTEGQYLVELSKKSRQSQSVEVSLGENARKVVRMSLLPLCGAAAIVEQPVVVDSLPVVEAKDSMQLEVNRVAKVTLKAFDDECEVLINREVVGRGTWSGELPEGQYYFMSRRGDLESRKIYYVVSGDNPVEVALPTPMAYYGVLNVSSNIVGAKIYLDAELVGVTPLVISNLDSDKRYDLELRKDGYISKKVRLKLISNALVERYIELKEVR